MTRNKTIEIERITATISRDGNAYEEGLSEGWNPIQRYWKEPTPANRAALRDFLNRAIARGPRFTASTPVMSRSKPTRTKWARPF